MSSAGKHNEGKSFGSQAKKLLDIKQKLKEKGLGKNHIGALIFEHRRQDPALKLYSWNEDRLFVPASLAKIAGLSVLFQLYPPSHTFKTAFVASAPLEKGILKGDLILKGGGDPGFVSESLWNLTNALTRSGLKEAQGDLLVDDSLYDGSGRLEPPSERSYHALTSPASFNWNSARFHIRPGKALKSPAKLFVDPENSYIHIVNKVKTGVENKIQIQRKNFNGKRELFEIRGTIALKEKELTFYRNVRHPPLWLGHSALSFLRQRGIKISGGVKTGPCRGDCLVLAEEESRPFAFHAYNLMKFSNNFVTRMLITHLPLLKGAEKGELKQGMAFVRAHLKEREKLKRFHFEEPSGLSRKNRFSPKDLHRLLLSQSHSIFQPEMLSSYPLAGGEGTLKERFKNLPPDAFVRAKTGSLDGVLGLAGWAGTQDSRYLFVFIFNGPAKKARQVEQLFDEMLLSLLQ